MQFLLIFCSLCFPFVTSALILKQNEIDITKHKNWPLVNNGGNCGHSAPALDFKSIGGHYADMGEYPWMARLMYRSFSKHFEKGFCGGSLINERYVLTAAHCCIDTLDKKLTYIRLGEYDQHHMKDCFRGRCSPPVLEVQAEELIKHPLFDVAKLINDVCLVRLVENVTFSDYIQPVCLPSEVVTDEELRTQKTNLTVAGWGNLENYPEVREPLVLQEIDLVLWDKDKCEEYLKRELNSERQICVGGLKAAQSACSGDSGGPLMYHNTTEGKDRRIIMGIATAAYPCTQVRPETTPTIFARVSTFMPWILDNIY